MVVDKDRKRCTDGFFAPLGMLDAVIVLELSRGWRISS